MHEQLLMKPPSSSYFETKLIGMQNKFPTRDLPDPDPVSQLNSILIRKKA